MAFDNGWRGPDIVSSNLVAYLDAGSPNSYVVNYGTTWRDISGNTNNGTLVNTPTFSDINGGAFTLNGTNQWISFGSTINTNAAFTLEFWALRSSDTTPTLFSGTAASGYLQIRMGSTSVSLVNSNIAELGNFGAASATSLNTVSQIVVTKTGTSCVGYTNGTQRNTLVVSATFTTANTTIGVSSGNGEPFTGRIYKFLYYNAVLSATEVLQNYNAQKSRFGL